MPRKPGSESRQTAFGGLPRSKISDTPIFVKISFYFYQVYTGRALVEGANRQTSRMPLLR